jgi:hypothetical protein
MSLPEDVAKFLATFIATVKSESIEWQKKHQADLAKLKKDRAVSEQELKELISEMEIRFKAKSQRIQIDENNKTKNFQDYLAAIDELKQQIKECFPQMQQALVLLIHHHATQLLVQAWDGPITQVEDKQKKYITLMMTIQEDMMELGESGQARKLLPEKTMKVIRGN